MRSKRVYGTDKVLRVKPNEEHNVNGTTDSQSWDTIPECVFKVIIVNNCKSQTYAQIQNVT